MGLLILLFIIGLPLVEIYFFIEVGEEIGAMSTVGLTILTAVVGIALVRAQGLGVVRRAEGYSSGMSVGDATFSGRLAGRAAANRRREGDDELADVANQRR